MNKAELRDAVMNQMSCSGALAERTVNCFLDAIAGGLKKDGIVQLMGFGTFVVRQRAARTGRNPTTGAPLQIPASKTVQFRVGKALKDGL